MRNGGTTDVNCAFSICSCSRINVMIAEYSFNGSIDKITPGFPVCFRFGMAVLANANIQKAYRD